MALARMLSLLSLGTVGLSTATVVANTAQKMFGHSIKGGHLVAYKEITVFEHKCSTPPCTITQLHCPTAGRRGWEASVLRMYVDGEAQASIELTLLELANVGKFNTGGNERNLEPWGVALFGHTAENGGVYSTVRFPFGSSVKVTLKSSLSGTYWFILRGVEAYPVVLGDLVLPVAARLRVHHARDVALQPMAFITMANVSRGTSGAVLSLKLDSTSTDMNYLEACVRAYIDGAEQPLFLSSGAEDYFLSAYYFNENLFKTPNSGLTFYDGKGTLSAYKVHDRDPILFSDGLALAWRNCEVTSGCGNTSFCPNQWCPPGATPVAVPSTAPGAEGSNVSRSGANAGHPDVAVATYSTTVWIYEWPKPAEGEVALGKTGCPGGALHTCVDACPSQPLPVFSACASSCGRRCVQENEDVLVGV